MKADVRRKTAVLSGRAGRVLVYTASLLTAPMPVMPYVRGTREYAWAVMACGAILTLSSFYVVRGEMRVKHRGLLGNKLLAASLITMLFGVLMVAGAIVYLSPI
jgi:heme/copper-type cytochrome/quinol oxidase subunit 3